MNSRPAFSELFFSKTKCFLEIFLPRQEQRSPETVKAYRISLAVFYSYVTDVKKINPMKFRFTDCTYELVLDYSQHLQEEKKMSNSSVNQRLAALKSYLRYAADGDIALVQVWLGVQKVPLLRLQKLQRPILGKNDLKIMLDTPEDSKCGNRDRAILILLFDSAARASELLGITLGDVLLNAEYPSILVHGKGKKERSIIMNPSTANHLRYYMRHYHQPDEPMDTPLFYTTIHGKKGKMSERNIERIVKKYAGIVRKEHPEMPESIYPHMFRRSRASGMYRDGVPLEMISAILGHSSSETTKIYAIPSVEQLREAISKGQTGNEPEKLWDGRTDEMKRMFGLG